MSRMMDELTSSLPDLTHLMRIVGRLTVALVIGAGIGLQRQLTHKSAGVRTHMLVALGTALLLVSATDAGLASSDVSRIVQGIITGIGFLGGGAILKLTDHQEIRGLTTAAGIWLTAAVGAAAGASLPLLAIATTVAYFATVYILAPLGRRLPASPYAPSAVRVEYDDGRGILRRVLEACTSRDFKVADVNVERGEEPGAPVAVSLEVHGSGSVATLAADLGEIHGVHGVAAGDVNEIFDV